VTTIEELIERKSSCSGLESRDYGRRGSAALTMWHPQKLALTSPTSGGRSVGTVRSQTQATESSLVFFFSFTFANSAKGLPATGGATRVYKT
jgi:hypothetical protein